MPSEQFLIILSPKHYYSYYEEWYDIDEGKKKKPLLFMKLQEQGAPQSQVHIADK